MPNLQLDGVDLFHREAGPLTGPPVLLIHGAGVDADAWGPVFDDLAQDHRVIAYDRRGHSRSAAEPAGDWSRHADDAAALLRVLDVGPATIVGWSAGGLIALDLAVRHPAHVASLVLLEAPLYARKNLTAQFVRHFIAFQLRRRLGRQEQAIDGYYRFITSYRSGGSVWDDPDYPAERRAAVHANASAIFAETAARDDHLGPERVSELRVPVTVVVGNQSPTWFERCAKATQRAIPGAQLETVRGMNHAASYTQAAALGAVIRTATGSATAPVASQRAG